MRKINLRKKNVLKIIIATVALTVLCGTAVLFLGADTNSVSDSVSVGTNQGGTQGIFMEPSPGRIIDARNVKIDYKVALQDFKDWAKYPPWSRPLPDEYTDVINPTYYEFPYDVLTYKDKQGTVRIVAGIQCRFQPADKYIWEGMKGVLFLSCGESGKGGTAPTKDSRMRLRISEITAKRLTVKGLVGIPSASIRYGDDGRNRDVVAGDNQYTVVFSPSRTDWGNIIFFARFQLEGDRSNRVYEFSRSIFSSPVAPARFTGRFSDTVTREALNVKIGVRVKKAGTYRFYANLKNENKYLSVAKTEKHLAAGNHIVNIRFSGKLLRDQRESGPYQVFGIRGYRRNSPLIDLYEQNLDDAVRRAKIRALEKRAAKNPDGREPDQEMIPPYQGTYTTARIEYREFTDSIYDSPWKRKRIAILKEAIKENEL